MDGARVLAAGPRFLATMQIPILAGREIDDRDQPGSRPVAVRSLLQQLGSSTALREQEEVALWGRVASFALDHVLWQDIAGLGELKVLSRDLKSNLRSESEYRDALSLVWTSRAEHILDEIILPYLDQP